MKFVFYALVAFFILLGPFVQPAGATPVLYDDLEEYLATFEDDPTYLSVELGYDNLGSSDDLVFTEADSGFTIEFILDNTGFAAIFANVLEDSPTSFTAFYKEGGSETFFVEESRKHEEQFFGIRGEDLIEKIEVTLGEGVTVTNIWHNNPAAPEPTTMLLLGSGLIGLAAIGRKKFFKK